MQRKKISNSARLFAGISVGFLFFLVTSHPKSIVHRKIPVKKMRNISLLPHIEYKVNEITYHFHHWLVISICYLPFSQLKKFRNKFFLHGIILGSILQGILYHDRFSIRNKNNIDTK